MMTDGIMSTIAEWTGHRPMSCPWNPGFDPFVHRVRYHRESYERGQLHVTAPDPSHRLVAGIIHYDSALKACEATRMEKERKSAHGH